MSTLLSETDVYSPSVLDSAISLFACSMFVPLPQSGSDAFFESLMTTSSATTFSYSSISCSYFPMRRLHASNVRRFCDSELRTPLINRPSSLAFIFEVSIYNVLIREYVNY